MTTSNSIENFGARAIARANLTPGQEARAETLGATHIYTEWGHHHYFLAQYKERQIAAAGYGYQRIGMTNGCAGRGCNTKSVYGIFPLQPTTHGE